MVPIEDLLKNKVIKMSFAEVAEYLLQVIAEKHAQKDTHLSTRPEATVPSPEHDDQAHAAPQ
jgi:hypothetical protein